MTAARPAKRRNSRAYGIKKIIVISLIMVSHYELTGQMIRARRNVDRYLRRNAPHIHWDTSHIQLVEDSVLNTAGLMADAAMKNNQGLLGSLVYLFAGIALDLALEGTAERYIRHDYDFCVYPNDPTVIHYSKPNVRDLEDTVASGVDSYELCFAHEATHCRITAEQMRRGVSSNSPWFMMMNEGFAVHTALENFDHPPNIHENPIYFDAVFLAHYFEEFEKPSERERAKRCAEDIMKTLDHRRAPHVIGYAICDAIRRHAGFRALVDSVIDPKEMPLPKEFIAKGVKL